MLAQLQADVHRHLEQQAKHKKLLLNDAREAREAEMALWQEGFAQRAAFNQAFLGVLDKQAMAAQRK